jgi:hypothetical protein
MANTVIALKKSATPSSVPDDLANGELAINFADGLLYYKNAAGQIVSFSSGGFNFSTINANNTLVIADTINDILTIEAGDNIQIVGDAINDKITISAVNTMDYEYANAIGAASNSWANTVVAGANGWTNTQITVVFDAANTAQYTANLAFDQANTGGGGGAYFQGNNGDVGSASGLGDIFRVHTNTLTANVTIYSGNNALAAGPISIATGQSLTIETDARVAIV